MNYRVHHRRDTIIAAIHVWPVTYVDSRRPSYISHQQTLEYVVEVVVTIEGCR